MKDVRFVDCRICNGHIDHHTDRQLERCAREQERRALTALRMTQDKDRRQRLRLALTEPQP